MPGILKMDITHQLEEAVTNSGIKTGSLHATCIGSTGSLTSIEFEPGVVADLAKAINELAPPGRDYEHERAWAEGVRKHRPSRRRFSQPTGSMILAN